MGILTDALFSRTLENPSTPLSDPDDFLFDALGARRASSGVSVSRENALNYSPVFRAIDLLATTIAKLPLKVFKRTENGKEPDPSHPAFNLLKYKANDEMTAFWLKKLIMIHAFLAKNGGFIFVSRLNNGDPDELIPLNPDTTFAVRETINGVTTLHYVTEVGDEMRKLRFEDVINIRVFSWDGITGISLLEKARDSIGLGIAGLEYSSKFFRNSARPGVVLEHPGNLSKDAQDNLVKSWDRMLMGLDNSHKTTVLEEGMKANIIGANAKDSQLLELMEFSIRDVSNYFGVPPHLLGDPSRTSFASLEQENLSFLINTLDGHLVNWEQELRDKLLTENQKRLDTHVIEYERNALMRADLTAKANFYKAALAGAAWMSPDEVRARENLNERPEGEGDTLLQPLNLAPEGTNVEALETETNSAPLQNSLERVLVDTVRRMTTRLGTQARKHSKNDEKFEEWLESFERDNRDVIFKAIDPIVTAWALAGDHNSAEYTRMVMGELFSVVHEDLTYIRGEEQVNISMEQTEANMPTHIVSILKGE